MNLDNINIRKHIKSRLNQSRRFLESMKDNHHIMDAPFYQKNISTSSTTSRKIDGMHIMLTFTNIFVKFPSYIIQR